MRCVITCGIFHLLHYGHINLLRWTASQDNDELEKEILQFDETEYEKRIATYKDVVGIDFGWRASGRIADCLGKILCEKRKHQ